MGLTALDVTGYITDTDPTDQTAPTVSSWFTKEDRKGIPESNLAWLIAQGWTISKTNDPDKDGVTTYNLSRTQIDAQKILTTLVADYTTAYNEGRTLNDTRYDEIVTIYAALQSYSETDWQDVEGDDTSYENLIESLISGLSIAYTNYENNVGDVLDDYGTSIATKINAQFDARLSEVRQDLVTRGMNNSTVWTSVATGIEREREIALTNSLDVIMRQQVDVQSQLHTASSVMRSKILSARDRMRSQIRASHDAHLASRNRIVDALLSFMERRTDDYPSLAEIGKLATALGAGNAAGFQP